MNAEVVLAAVIGTAPFVGLAGFLWLSGMIRARREAAIARQIALTDAIHHELGAAAAPVVRWSWTRGWVVSVALPLYREGLVGVVTRITHDLFRRLDHQDPPRVRLVLRPQDLGPRERARTIGAARPARLRRAA
jgi:hypothetical protein